jgi:hypothetical protein
MGTNQTSKVYLTFIKLVHFLVAMLISEQIFGTAFTNFIELLNEKGILNLGENFNFGIIIWGENLGPNILHTIILIFLASVFGFVLGYLQPKLNKLEKITFALFYAFFRFLLLYIVQFFIAFFLYDKPNDFDNILGYQYHMITYSYFNSIFFLIGQLAIIYFSISFMNIGIKTSIENDQREKGTFLGIKWYHFLWLYIPIIAYFHLFLYLTHRFFISLTNVLKEFKIFDFLFRGGGPYGEMSKDGEYSIAVIITFIVLLIIYILFINIIWWVMKYLRLIVIGDTSQSLWVKILLCVLLGIVIPTLISFYYLN